MAETAGSVCTMSPSELGLMIRIDFTNQRSKDRSQKSEVRSQRSEVRRQRSASDSEALGQKSRQIRGDDFLLGGFEVVFYATLLNDIFLRVVNAVSRAPIAIARLTNTADVNEVFLAWFDRELFYFQALHAVIVAHIGHRHMRVPEETKRRVLIRETGGGIEIVKY